VRIEGDGARDPAFMRAVGALPLRKGDVLVHQNYELAKAALVNAALRTGYLDAHYTANAIRVDLQRYQAAVVLHYQTGWQHLFGELVFHQDVLNPGILEGYANFKRGTPVDYAKLTELESNLASSNQFSRVEVRPRVDLERNREVPIHAELEPARRTRFTAGAGIGSDAGPFGNLGVEFRRLNRRGHRARIETTIGQIEQSGTAQYQIPWPYPRTDVLTLAAAHGREKTQTTNELTTAGSTTITRAFGNWTEGYSLAYRIQEYEVGIDRGTERFLAPRGSWTYTMRNQPLDPRLGRRILFDTEGAWKGVVSTRSYVRGLAQASWLQAFRGARNRIILRGDLGGLWTNAFRQLPGSIRFFAGGSNSVRGYGYNSLGAKDSLGNVIGGSLLMVGSAEYEYRFLPRWGAAVFYDIGNAVLSSSDPLESGAGVGARWVSPVGMVRVDLAFPLSERGRRMMIHFGIGTGL
jgi:translocation and assembly module TamA